MKKVIIAAALIFCIPSFAKDIPTYITFKNGNASANSGDISLQYWYCHINISQSGIAKTAKVCAGKQKDLKRGESIRPVFNLGNGFNEVYVSVSKYKDKNFTQHYYGNDCKTNKPTNITFLFEYSENPPKIICIKTNS